MKIKEFIPVVLMQIEEGLNDIKLKGKDARIKSFGNESGVEFDIAVSAVQESSGKIGAEVLSIGAKAERKISKERVNRIKFRVVYFHDKQDNRVGTEQLNIKQ